MAGPAIRAVHMARALAVQHTVDLVTTNRSERFDGDVGAGHVEPDELERLAARADVVVMQGDALRRAPGLGDVDAALVVDLYDPFHLEIFEPTRHLDPATRRRTIGTSIDVVNEQIRRGDFFLCASPRQRDFWLGHLAAAGRVNERTYDADPGLASLIAVVPFGVEDEPPRHRAPAMRGVVPGIDASDEIVFWGGGIYDWFDPLTAIRAIDRLRHRRPQVRLFFAGARHPNASVGETAMAARAGALADDLGITGRHVFFHDWVVYDDRESFLVEADIGLSTHVDHLETAFSFRTRVLDYLWAGLPTVTTQGDTLAEVVDREGAGIAVPPGDPDALEAALEKLLADDALRAASGAAAQRVAARYRWSSVLQPLLEFCAEPVRSPDLRAADTARAIARGGDLVAPGWRDRLPPRVRGALGRARRALSTSQPDPRGP
jgi:glycosyltransferase involved in cell wall biosynthesis